MHALFAIIRNDFIFCMHFQFDPIMCMDPQGLALPAFKEIEAQSTLFAASLKALLPMTP